MINFAVRAVALLLPAVLWACSPPRPQAEPGVLTVGPGADGLILSSRRRLLRQLRAWDADGAAREMEHHLKGLHYMGRLACGASTPR